MIRLAGNIQFLIVLYLIKNKYPEIVVEPDYCYSPAGGSTSLVTDFPILVLPSQQCLKLDIRLATSKAT